MSEIKYATIPLIDIFTIGRGLPNIQKHMLISIKENILYIHRKQMMMVCLQQ